MSRYIPSSGAKHARQRKGPDPTPLVLTHGWPWTFDDCRSLIGPLRWSDCRGSVESYFSLDDLISTVMLYWTTGSFPSAVRFYSNA